MLFVIVVFKNDSSITKVSSCKCFSKTLLIYRLSVIKGNLGALKKPPIHLWWAGGFGLFYLVFPMVSPTTPPIRAVDTAAMTRSVTKRSISSCPLEEDIKKFILNAYKTPRIKPAYAQPLKVRIDAKRAYTIENIWT